MIFEVKYLLPPHETSAFLADYEKSRGSAIVSYTMPAGFHDETGKKLVVLSAKESSSFTLKASVESGLLATNWGHRRLSIVVKNVNGEPIH